MDKVKVLHIINEFIPPTEQWLLNLIDNTSGIRHYIAPITLNDNSGELIKKYNYLDLTMHKTSAYFLRLRPQYTWWSKVKKKILSLIISSTEWVSLYQIKRYISRHRIDIIHYHFGPLGAKYAPHFQSLNVKHVTSFYGYDYQKVTQNSSYYREKYKSLNDIMNAFLTEGQWGKLKLKEIGIDGNKIRIARLGVKPQKNDRKIKLNEVNKLRFVQVASFTPKKGQKTTIRAFTEALKTIDAELTLIGDARDSVYYEECKALINASDHGGRIRLIEFIPYEKLQDELVKYCAFLQPSQHAKDGDCEGGIPTSLFEAQRIGLPVIATNHCDISDLIENNKNGFIVEENDNHEQFQEALIKFSELTNDERLVMSRNAISVINAKFDIEKNGDKLRMIYLNMKGKK